MRLSVGYPTPGDEKVILTNLQREHPINQLHQVVDGSQLPALQRQVWEVHVDETIKDYILRLVTATRNHPELSLGGSPRASLALFKAAQGLAALRGRDFVLPEDVKELAQPTLAHRLIIRPEFALRGRTSAMIVQDLVKNTALDLGGTSA
jgi:MoxR-like ATPase